MGTLCKVFLALLVVVVLFTDSGDGWGRRRRRRSPRNCLVNNWNNWGRCNQACRRGYSYRYRYVRRSPCCGGRGCPSTRQWRYCNTYNGGCQQYCTNRGGNPYCYCRSGYYKSGSRCYDVNECSSQRPCNQICRNTYGSYYCQCYYGYYLKTRTYCDRVSCGVPRIPNCPSSSYRDSFGTTCNKVYIPSCGNLYRDYCYPRCSSSNYKLATYYGGGAFLSDYSRTRFESISRIQCQGNKQWTSASLLSRLYCRRVNDPPTTLSITTTGINEGTAVGTVVARFSTSDPQSSQSHTYTMRSGTVNTGFYLFRVSGNQLINRWVPALNARGGITHSSFVITIRTTDNGQPNMYKEQQFTIRVINKNDKPEDIKLTPWQVKENVNIGTRVGYLTAYDPDIPTTTNPCASWILRDSDNGFFRISGNAIYVAKSLNHEAQSFHSITVICTDKVSSAYSTSQTLVIDVQDAKDPPISITIDKKNVDENSKVGTLVGTVTAIDEDDENLKLTLYPTSSTFALSGTTCVDVQSSTTVHRKSCSAKLAVRAATLNWELKSWYLLTLYAQDSSPAHLHKVLVVNVTVNNLNEQPTAISLPTPTIQENSPGGSQISDLDVSDPDNQVQLVQRPTCVLGAGGDNSKFQIEGQSPNYDLALAKDTVVDYEKKKSYSITVMCNDHGLPDMSITRSFTIMVQDVNEAPTDITLDATAVKENAPVNTIVGTLTTTDPDPTPQTAFKYTLLPHGTKDLPFKIVGRQLIVNSSIDYETEEAYVLTIAVDDNGGLEYIGIIDLNVTDVPEGPTSVTLDGSHTFPENSAAGTLIGNIIVTDQDFNQLPTCAVAKDYSNGALAVAGTGGDELVCGSRTVDYESEGGVPLKVDIKCTDSTGLSKTSTFSVMVTDTNEASTNITLDTNTVPENTAPYTVGQLTVEDPDVGQTHNCSVQDNPNLPAGQIPESQLFKITKTNQLQVIQKLDYEGGLDTYSVHILCSDIPTSPNQTSYVIERDILVYVINQNEPPTSPCVGTNWQITEAAAPGTIVSTPLMATDPDAGQTLSFSIKNRASVPFYVNTTNDAIFTSGNLDYETNKFYDLQVTVTDNGKLMQVVPTAPTTSTPVSATYTCRVNILDANDPHSSIDIKITPPNPCVDEHVKAGTTIATLSTSDVDATATFAYTVSPANGPFAIDGNKLVAKTVATSNLDSEAGVTSVVVIINSTDNHGYSVQRTFTICIKPVNENATKMCLLGDSVEENAPGVKSIGQIIVQDPDVPLRTCGPPPLAYPGLGFNYSCNIDDDTSGQVYSDLFQVDSLLHLQLKQGKSLNYEAVKTYHIPVTCADKLAPFNTIASILTVNVKDVNEAPTNIVPSTASGSQNQPYNATSSVITVTVPEHQFDITLLTLTCQDPDYPSSTPLVTYTASGDGVPGMIEMQHNMLVLKKALDYETKNQYVINVQVTDDGKPPPAMTTTIKVIVNVQDSNDLPTQINLVCPSGAWFPFANTSARPAAPAVSGAAPTSGNRTVPVWNSNLILHPGISESAEDCSRLMSATVKPGDVIGEIYPKDQDSQRWYSFTLLGADAQYFTVYPYGTVYLQKYAHSALLMVSSNVDVYNFTYNNPVYNVYVDVYDNYGMQEVGHIVHIQAFDACYSKSSECVDATTCMPSKTSLGNVQCSCPVNSVGDGRVTSLGGTGCKSCGAGEKPDGLGMCKQVDECASNPCLAGKCIDGNFSFTCVCPTGYSGDRCQTNLEGCALNTGSCQNGASCVDSNGLGALTCNCAAGFTGRHCEYYQSVCSDFPSTCSEGAKFCAFTPHLQNLESTPLCVHNVDMVHVIVVGVPSGADAGSNKFYHAVGGYMDEVLASAGFGLNFNTFASNQLGLSSSSRSRRSTMYTKLEDKPYLTQVLNVTKLPIAGAVLASATVLVKANSYKMASAASICPKLSSIKDMRCAGANDCAILEQIHFRCSAEPLSSQSPEIQADSIAYVQIFDATAPTVPVPCNEQRDCNAEPTKEARVSDAPSTPFYETGPGIAIICLAIILLLVAVLVGVYFSRKNKDLNHKYEDRRLIDEDSMSTTSGLSGLSSGVQGRDSRHVTGIRNPLFDSGEPEPLQIQNDVYDTADPDRVVENAVYDSSDTTGLYEELPH